MMRLVWMLTWCLLALAYLATGWPSDSVAQAQEPLAAAADNANADKDAEESADADESTKDDDDQAADDNDDDDDKEEVADDKKSDKDQSKESERETYTVKAKPLKVEVESDVVFAAREMSKVDLDPEAWTEFKIVEIVPHGTTVHKGEVLVKFDGEKIKEALDNLDLDLRLNELSITKAEQELPRVEKSIKDSFEQAERQLAEAKVDYENYEKVDRDLLVKSIEMSYKSTEQAVENAREELHQLEKMYEADDLTEETEEIILKRQRAEVEQYEFYLERAKLSRERNLDLYLPRNDIAEKEYLERMELAFARAKTSLETDLDRARYDLEKSKRSRKDSLERHSDLTSDLNLLTLKAPSDGIVYYGTCDDGQWSDMANLISKLKPDNNAPTGQTLMTIVGPAELYAVSSVKEADRPSVQQGQRAVVKPTATDSPKLEAKVTALSAIPVASGKFSMDLELTTDELPEWLVAGMTGKAKVTTYEEDEALLVPKKALHSDEEDEDQQYVWLVDDEEVQRRDVKTGKTKGDDVEIVKGLEAGDVISLDDEKKSDDED